MKSALSLVVACGLAAIAIPSNATEMQANKDQLSELYTGTAYSPYAKRSYPERPLWGDNHLHTSLSMDAGGFGNRVPPADAYRLARGEEIIASSGQPVRLSRPLDWLAWPLRTIPTAWALSMIFLRPPLLSQIMNKAPAGQKAFAPEGRKRWKAQLI